MEQNKQRDEATSMREPEQPDQEEQEQSQKTSRGRRGRVFDYGELRLLLLAMLAERPSHGYELIHEVKARFGGMYKPSPGVIYPALTWLYDRSYTEIELEKGGRKRYSITEEGHAFLAANQAFTEMLMARVQPEGNGASPDQILAAMDHLKRALSLRIKLEPVSKSVIDRMAEYIHAAADNIEALLNESRIAKKTAKTRVVEIATPNAERFLKRMCSHFQHRTPVVAEGSSGQFRISIGEVRMNVLDGIFKITLVATSEEHLLEMQNMMERHLNEAAVREVLQFDWK